MNLDVYKAALATSGKMKLRAKAKLADGRPEQVFEACVLLHEAARAELRAVRLIEAPAVTQLGALAEACYCLVEGLDPHGAAGVYSMLYVARESVPAETATAMLSRLTSRYEKLQRRYAKAVGELKALRPALEGGLPLVPAPIGSARQARREAKRMTRAFPGVAGWWWVAYRLAESSDDDEEAWRALEQARRLDPENVRFEAVGLLAATRALDRRGAEAHLAAARPRLRSERPELCLMYALSEIRLARTGRARDRSPRWLRALDAVRTGLSGEPSAKTRNNLRATHLLLTAYLDGTPPSLELLYRAGLEHVAVAADPDADIEQLLTESVRDAA